MLCDKCLDDNLEKISSAKDWDSNSEGYQNYIIFREKVECSVCGNNHLNHYYNIEETVCINCANEHNICQMCKKDMTKERQGKQLFELHSKSADSYDWVIKYTGVHPMRDISYLGELLCTVENVQVALENKYSDVCRSLGLTLVDIEGLMSILGEIEMFSQWNNFENRDPEEIADSIISILVEYWEVFD